MSDGDLAALADHLRACRGLAHKADIGPAIRALGGALSPAIRLGDDCAAIADGDGWLLFAIEGFIHEFVAADPFFAGWCGIMVNLSDIAAMGGRPIAVTDAVWGRDAAQLSPILAGMSAAATTYGVPVAGGHTNARAGGEALAVAVLGRAARLLTSFDARPGDVLVAAIDLRGAYREPAAWWDASAHASPDRLRGDLDLLPEIAEAGLCEAAKDISMAGLVGTALMLAESSGIGLVIEVDAVPRPAGAELARWLTAFPSFGFLLAVRPTHLDAVRTRFAGRGIAAAAIGRCVAGSEIWLEQGGARALFWDHARTALIAPHA